MRFVIAVTILCLLAGEASAQEAVDRVAALDKQCEAARQDKLKPIRAQKIEQCVANGNRSRDSCEIFYSTYGNNSNHANGSVIRGQFYNLPECVTARKALRGMQNKQNF